MKYTLLFFVLLSFLTANAQNEAIIDTIYSNNIPAGLLKKSGTGFIAYSLDGKQRFINIKENYYRFANGLIAYPDVTVRSAEKTLEIIAAGGLFNKSGLDDNKVNEFVNRYATPLPVQQLQRESRQEINTEVK
ncbi:MAG: hypothetical protein POELPBGB_03122 [Bacteroidia bacterium]|nr:hypothetical protein [Bacteroidia bacterium]